MNDDLEPNEPSDLESESDEPEEPSDLDYIDVPCTDDMGDPADESQWEALIPDDDQWDPEPDPGDFWIENDPRVSPPHCLLV